MRQSCFSLGFLSQNSLWKFSIFRGYNGAFILEWEWNVKSQFFHNKVDWWLGLATWLSCESKLRANWMASLDFLSCSATAGKMVQLLYMLHLCASFGDLQAASHPRDPTASPCFTAQSWAFLYTLTHYPYMIPT